MSVTEELQAMRSEIEKTKVEMNKLEGQKDTYSERLEREFGLKTIVEAKERLQELKETLTGLNNKLEKGIAEIKGKYDFGETL